MLDKQPSAPGPEETREDAAPQAGAGNPAPPARQRRRRARQKPQPEWNDLVAATAQLRHQEKTSRLTAPVQIALVLGILLLLGALSLALPKPTVSEYEKRELAGLPKFSVGALLSGEYFKGLELFYADTFPFREAFVRLSGKISESYGLRADDVRIYNAPAANNPPQGGPSPQPLPGDSPTAPTPPQYEGQPGQQEPQKPPEVVDDGTVGETAGSLFIYKGQAFSLFTPNNRGSQRYAQAINSFHAKLGDAVTVYNLVIPTHIDFALPERYKGVTMPQKPNIDYIYSLLDPAVKPVDAYTNIQMHSDEYLYFSTDHHWTGLGAYYAYQAFCDTAGLESVPLESMEKRTIPDFIGTLYAESGFDSSLLQNPDYVDYWVIPTPHTVLQYRRGDPFNGHPSTLLAEHAKGANSYSVFLQGDYPLTKITTNIKNGRKIAVVKESFGNAFAPFLVNHYEEVYVVDQRYYQLNLPAMLTENGIHELLFINNIYAANTDIRIRETERLLTQTFLPYTPPSASREEEEPPEEPAHSREPQEESRPGKAKKSSSSTREEFDPWAEDEKK